MLRLTVTAIALTVGLCSSAPLLAGEPSAPGPFGAGRKDVTVTRPNGTTFVATLHYPATESGVNKPFDPSGGPYPIVSFGHGFVQPVTQYQSTLSHLATHGYFVIASQSNGGIAPSHAGFAADLRSCVDWLLLQGAAGAQFGGAVAADRIAFSGHSIGGGAALLAAKDDAREVAVVTLAAAETNPSAIAAASAIGTPARLIVGSQDTIVPPASSAAPMYANFPGPRQLCTIEGGFHCGFTDADFLFCDSGSITRAVQLEKTRGLMTRFLDQYLKFDAATPTAPWTETWGAAAPGVAGVTLSSDPGASITPSAGTVVGPLGGTGTIAVTVTHLDAAPQAYELLGDGVTFVPPSTSVLGQGVSFVASATIAIPANATAGDQVLLSARNASDHATRTYVALMLQPTPARNPADLDGNGTVDAADLAVLLGAWGSGGPADLDGSGTVDASDLAVLLGAWG